MAAGHEHTHPSSMRAFSHVHVKCVFTPLRVMCVLTLMLAPGVDATLSRSSSRVWEYVRHTLTPGLLSWGGRDGTGDVREMLEKAFSMEGRRAGTAVPYYATRRALPEGELSSQDDTIQLTLQQGVETLSGITAMELFFHTEPHPEAPSEAPLVTVCIHGGYCQLSQAEHRKLDQYGLWTIIPMDSVLKKWRLNFREPANKQYLTFTLSFDVPVMSYGFDIGGTKKAPTLVFFTGGFDHNILNSLGRPAKKIQALRQKRSLPSNEIPTSNLCRKHEWRVNVTDLGWGHIISNPSVLDLGYCAGDCSPQLLNATTISITNNAYLRGLYQQFNGHVSNVPRPCCVPTKSNDVIVMKDGDTQKVHALHFLRVVRCGCV